MLQSSTILPAIGKKEVATYSISLSSFMLASMTLGKKFSCELFYLLVRYSEVAGMLFEAPTLISFAVFLLIFISLFVCLC